MKQQRRTSTAGLQGNTASAAAEAAFLATQSNSEYAENVVDTSSASGESWLFSAASEHDPEAYSMVEGDTLYSLAKRHGTTVDAIINANKQKLTTIVPGQVLKIPGQGNTLHCVRGASKELGRAGDTLYSLAKEYGVGDWREIVAINLPVGISLTIPGYSAKAPESTNTNTNTNTNTPEPSTSTAGKGSSAAEGKKAVGPSVRFDLPKAPIQQGRINVLGKTFAYAIKLTGRVTATTDSSVVMSQDQLAVKARTAFTQSFSSSLQISQNKDGTPTLTSTLMSDLGSTGLSFNGVSFIVDHRPPATDLEFAGYSWVPEIGLRLELTPLFEPKSPAPPASPVTVPVEIPSGQGYWTAVSVIIGTMFAVEVGAAAIGAIMEGPSPVMKLLALGLSIGVVMQIMWNWGDIDARARAMA